MQFLWRCGASWNSSWVLLLRQGYTVQPWVASFCHRYPCVGFSVPWRGSPAPKPGDTSFKEYARECISGVGVSGAGSRQPYVGNLNLESRLYSPSFFNFLFQFSISISMILNFGCELWFSCQVKLVSELLRLLPLILISIFKIIMIHDSWFFLGEIKLL